MPRAEHPEVVVGVGAARGVGADEVLAAVDAVLPPGAVVRALATLDTRAAEPGLREAAELRGWPLTGHPAGALAAVAVPSPSARVAAAVGTPSVAEAAALLHGDDLLVPKTPHGRVTVAISSAQSPRSAPSNAHSARSAPSGAQSARRAAMTEDLGHHGDDELGPGLVDLAVNVRAGTPPGWLRTVLHEAVASSAGYPDPTGARRAVAALHHRDPGEVLLAAGAAEVFTLVARALRPRRAVVVHPSFTEPEVALRAAGHEVERLVLDGPRFRLDPDAVPADADLVVLGNPTNPTSVLHPAATLRALAREGRVLLVDEAFADTVPGEPESLAAERLPGLLVVRSLTKTWGLAGIRVGYALGPADLVAELAAQQPHWSVSTPALAALVACAEPHAQAEAAEAARQTDRDRAVLLAVLPAGVVVEGDPRSSFVLLRVPEGARVRERLRAAGWAVRRGDTFPGLGPDHLRVAVRDPATSVAFARALAAAMGTPLQDAAGAVAILGVAPTPEEHR